MALPVRQLAPTTLRLPPTAPRAHFRAPPGRETATMSTSTVRVGAVWARSAAARPQRARLAAKTGVSTSQLGKHIPSARGSSRRHVIATVAWLDGAKAAAAQGGSSPNNRSINGANPQRLPTRKGDRGEPGDAPGGGGDPDEDEFPDFVWDPKDALFAYGSLAAVLGMGTTSWLQDQRYGYVPYFLGLAVCAIYIASHRGLTREDRETFGLNQSAFAPVALSISLLAIYCILKYTPFDLASLVSGYFWLLSVVAVTSNVAVPIAAAAGDDWAERELIEVPLPEGVAEDKVTGAPVTSTPLTNAYALAGAVGLVAATADVALGHGNHTVNNFLATMIVADFLSLIGLGSFAAAGALLLGLLCYDAFWVFGSGYVFGDGTADSNVMMAVATSDSFQGPFRLLFPRFEDVLNPPPPSVIPFSLLGLGDVAVPGLLACLALRYDASRATDMRGRATAAAAAFMSAFDAAWEEADAEETKKTGDAKSRANSLDESVADRAARAAEEAFDGAADALGDTASGEGGSGEGVRNMVVPRSMGGRAFFSATLLGYAAGLTTACYVNVVTGQGQPALVYLVPTTLGAVAYTAVRRGEVGRLMSYKEPERET